MIQEGSKLRQQNKSKQIPVLFVNQENCCGCSACFAICPVNAITMLPDEEGFLYPVVDEGICIRCYRCLSVCAYKLDQANKWDNEPANGGKQHE